MDAGAAQAEAADSQVNQGATSGSQHSDDDMAYESERLEPWERRPPDWSPVAPRPNASMTQPIGPCPCELPPGANTAGGYLAPTTSRKRQMLKHWKTFFVKQLVSKTGRTTAMKRFQMMMQLIRSLDHLAQK
ncbi:hypothetical protein MMC16_007861 [Acarospora aff. strigata]|nr:hypothetical protein [Acarospora aff. strigata]